MADGADKEQARKALNDQGNGVMWGLSPARCAAVFPQTEPRDLKLV
jgi:hypothetical protein